MSNLNWPKELACRVSRLLPAKLEALKDFGGPIQFRFDIVLVNIICPFRMYRANPCDLLYFNNENEYDRIISLLSSDIDVVAFSLTQKSNFITDLDFGFSNGFHLDLFSDGGPEPWTIDFHGKPNLRDIYIGNDPFE